MAVLAVVTSSPPGAEGGHLVIARSLVQAARVRGHDAHLVVTTDFGFGRTLRSYLASWNTNVRTVGGQRTDRVVSLRYPSFAVRHPSHVCWLNHTMREYYDLWAGFAASISSRARVKENVRKAAIRSADWYLLHFNVNRVVAQSHTIEGRLRRDLSVRAEVLWPPPPQRPYRCDRYGDHILAVSRLTPHKRIDLIIRALAEPAARNVRVVVGGDGESRRDLETLARELGVERRIVFVGRMDDEALVTNLADCRAVCFPPLAEDYGFVTAEAFASGKAVITCSDSGGPTELVRDGETGLIAQPTPSSLAAALSRLMDDSRLAGELGARALAQATSMSWDAAVDTLLA
jgi:glycosyltransferase involved in cell wall biosynthesis